MRYSYERIHVLLKREGSQVNQNHKRVFRLIGGRGSRCLIAPKRHRSAAHRPKPMPSHAINECLSMDFVADQLFDGRRLRALTLVDIFNNLRSGSREETPIIGCAFQRAKPEVLKMQARTHYQILHC